jgi:hypothetical protein
MEGVEYAVLHCIWFTYVMKDVDDVIENNTAYLFSKWCRAYHNVRTKKEEQRLQFWRAHPY